MLLARTAFATPSHWQKKLPLPIKYVIFIPAGDVANDDVDDDDRMTDDIDVVGYDEEEEEEQW